MIAGVPYDAEVEYLQCVGFDTYVDTGVYPNATTDCEVGVSFAGSNTNYPTPIGMVDGTTRYLIRYGSPDSFFQLSAGNGVAFTSRSRNGPSSTNIGYQITFKISGGKSYVDGVQTSTLYNSVVNLDDFRYTLWVGNQNYQGGFNPNCSATNMQITFCKIWKNGVLVRDYIPVRRGMVGYLYDRVSGKLFGNAGTGAFVLGPDKARPVMSLHRYGASRFGKIGAGARMVRSSPLPPGARWVEYLESMGTQWIDTGITPKSTDTTAFIFTQSYSKFTTVRLVWGSNYGANQGANEQHYYVCGVNVSSVQMQIGEIYNCETRVLPNKIVQGFINGEMFRDNQGSDPYVNPFYIFALGGPHTTYARFLRIHELKVIVNGITVRDFRPIAIGTTGYMLDLVSGEYMPYGNKGTGDFILGPDIPSPI